METKTWRRTKLAVWTRRKNTGLGTLGQLLRDLWH